MQCVLALLVLSALCLASSDANPLWTSRKVLYSKPIELKPREPSSSSSSGTASERADNNNNSGSSNSNSVGSGSSSSNSGRPTLTQLLGVDIDFSTPCVCQKINFPVCGSDGEDYVNPCTARCFGASVQCFTPCSQCSSLGR